ncbi:hypothetical protein BH10CHL1_BH10CHL1_37360 [soil metagenome]
MLAPTAYLYQATVDSTIYAIQSNGTPLTDQRYFAYGRIRNGDTLPTDHWFTGQQVSSDNGLYYYGARYYDPEIGQFISPDSLVPDATNVFDYNRYMYARGNPIKYTDPTGHYSQEELMKHFGCDNAQCVSDHFGPNGDYADLWGWFYILTQAHDGDSIYAHSITLAADGKTQLDDELRGTFATVNGKIMIQMASTANWNSNGGMNTTTFGPGALVSEKVGSVYGAMGVFGEYRVDGKSSAYANPSVKHANCSYDDCVGLALDGLSDAASAVAVGCTLAGQGECAAPAIAVGKGLTMLSVGYASYQTFVTGGSTGTDLVVTLATSGVSYFGSPVAGLFAGETQTFYDYNSLQRRP